MAGVSLDAAARLRAFCARDLVETERAYIEALQILCVNYRKPLIRFVQEHPCTVEAKDVDLLIPEDVESIFLPSHQNFEARLRPACQQLEENLDPTKLLLLFQTDLPFHLAHYKNHCRSQFERIDMLRKMKEDSLFSAEIDRLQSEQKSGQTLESEISKLPTRVMRYALLLGDLCKYIEACEESSAFLQGTVQLTAARNALTKVTNDINDACRWADTKYINVLMGSINLLPSVLMRPTLKMRSDLYEGMLGPDECKILLFDDGVVILRAGVGNAQLEFVKLIPVPLTATSHDTTVQIARKDHPEVTELTILKQISMLHPAEAQGSKAAQLFVEDVKTLGTQGNLIRLKVVPLHRGFPSCSIDRAARVRCAITFAVLSLFYMAGASMHGHKTSDPGWWNRMANLQLKLFGYFMPFGWVLGLHYQYVVHVQSERNRFWKEFCADFSSWAHIYLIARFVIEPLANILWPLLTLGRWSLTVGEDRQGAASHAIMTLIACGYAMLASDSKWFQWSSFRSMLSAPNLSHRYAAWALLVSGAYLVFLYCNMAFTTTRYYHTFEEFVAAFGVATVVLGGYVLSFDHFSNPLRYVSDSQRQRKMVFLVGFLSALVFIFVLSSFVIAKKYYAPTYRIASGFFVFTTPAVAASLSLTIGTAILFLCHGDIVLALHGPLWALCLSIVFLLFRLLIGSQRALVGAHAGWYVVFFAIVSCVVQIFDVATFAHRLPNSNSFPLMPSSWASKGVAVVQDILLSMLPLFYFLLCLQLFAHFYSGVMHLHDNGSLWWLPFPIVLSGAGLYAQPQFRSGLVVLSRLKRQHEA